MEILGMIVGVWMAPSVALVALIRRGRVFHTEGSYYDATVHALATDGPAGKLAERLQGDALVRFSSGAQRRITDKKRDFIGFTIRFVPNDQDLLFASFRTVTTASADMKTSDNRQLLNNTFHTATPATDPDLGTTTFRVTGQHVAVDGMDSGEERLATLVDRGEATLVLAAEIDGAFVDIAEIVLTANAEHADEETQFSPFRTGRGIEPTGFLTGIRRVAYPVSRWARGVPTS